MGMQVKSNGRIESKQGRAFSDGRLWQLWQRLLRRPASDTGAHRSAQAGELASVTHHGDATVPGLVRAPLSRPDVEVLWSTGTSDQNARWIHHVLRVVGMAVGTAPSRRQSWTMRLRLREDVLPQCSLTIAVSPDVLHLRFRSSDLQSLALLSDCKESLGSALTTLVGRATEVDVVDEYFGLA